MNKDQEQIILYLLTKGKGKSVNQISNQTKISKERVEKAVLELESAGMVKITRSPSGKKINDVILTDKGLKGFR